MLKKFLSDIAQHLLHQDQTIAVAESVTAGNLQATFSLADDAMKFFQGGITTYNLGQKARHLEVDPIHAVNCNCVSETIASQMALRASKLFSSNWGIGITGYASPDPQHGINKLFAFFSITFENEVIMAGKINCDKQTVKEAQAFYTRQTLAVLRDHLKKVRVN